MFTISDHFKCVVDKIVNFTSILSVQKIATTAEQHIHSDPASPLLQFCIFLVTDTLFIHELLQIVIVLIVIMMMIMMIMMNTTMMVVMIMMTTVPAATTTETTAIQSFWLLVNLKFK